MTDSIQLVTGSYFSAFDSKPKQEAVAIGITERVEKSGSELTINLPSHELVMRLICLKIETVICLRTLVMITMTNNRILFL